MCIRDSSYLVLVLSTDCLEQLNYWKRSWNYYHLVHIIPLGHFYLVIFVTVNMIWQEICASPNVRFFFSCPSNNKWTASTICVCQQQVAMVEVAVVICPPVYLQAEYFFFKEREKQILPTHSITELPCHKVVSSISNENRQETDKGPKTPPLLWFTS